ncbi:MAG: ABC transporter permease [Clostridia bacterium]|nr:ABC transporter permease [Clostridia bacterium]
MSKMSVGNQPFLRIVKRDGLTPWKSWLIRGCALLIALVICALFVYSITKLNPLSVYGSMAKGAFGTTRRMWITFQDTAVLLCVALGLAPAFKMKFWNIGAEGQILVGGISTAACMIYLGDVLPLWLTILLMVVSSTLAGALWGLIPALFKAKWNTNETLFTLMMNYIAIQLTLFFVAKWENPIGSNTVGVINPDTKGGWLPEIGSSRTISPYLLPVIIVLALTVFMFFYLRNSKQGYEISIVGDSENTARYAGMNVKKIVLRTMLLSGGICGLAGFINVAGISHTISTSTSDGRGFTAIIVAWLAKFNAFVMIFVSLLLIFLEKGASQIASDYGLNNEASEIMKGIILFFVLGSEFFINYRLVFCKKEERGI